MSAKNVEIFRQFASRPAAGKPRRLVFHFLKSPVALVGAGRLEQVMLARNRLEGEPFQQVAWETGETETLPCGLLFRSIEKHKKHRKFNGTWESIVALDVAVKRGFCAESP